MNDNTILLVGAGVLAVVALGFFLYSAVRGVSGSLSTAKVGEIYNFEYEHLYR